jgi:hypothetical protein
MAVMEQSVDFAEKVKFPSLEEIREGLESRITSNIQALNKLGVPVDSYALTHPVSYRGKDADVAVNKYSGILTRQRGAKDYINSDEFPKEYETVKRMMNASDNAMLDLPKQFTQSIILENYTARIVNALRSSGFDELGDAVEARIPQVIAKQRQLRNKITIVGGRIDNNGSLPGR